MKLNIDIRGFILSGYTTVSPAGGLGKPIDHRNLDAVCEANECEEIYAPHVLNHIHVGELDQVITHYISKLRHGGKLIIGGADIRDLAKKIIKDEITVEESNRLLYGPTHFNWVNHCSMYAMHDIVALLRSKGLKVVSQKCDDFWFSVEAQRD